MTNGSDTDVDDEPVDFPTLKPGQVLEFDFETNAAKAVWPVGTPVRFRIKDEPQGLVSDESGTPMRGFGTFEAHGVVLGELPKPDGRIKVKSGGTVWATNDVEVITRRSYCVGKEGRLKTAGKYDATLAVDNLPGDYGGNVLEIEHEDGYMRTVHVLKKFTTVQT